MGTKRTRAAIAVAGLLVLTSCSGSGGARAHDSPPDDRGYVIAMVTHESPGDSFWDKVRAGAERAADHLGVTLRYAADPDGGRQATLVQNAIDSRVDGVAVTLSQAEQVGPSAQRALTSGIPVVAFNAGIDNYRDYGIGMYFGSDEILAGRAAGQRLTQEPDGRTLCVLHEQGSVSHEARCRGVSDTTPNTENLQVNGADLPSVQQTIQAKLQEDPSITRVVTLGAPVAMAAVQAKAASGSSAAIATFDLDSDVATAVKDGRIEFSVDQQPYVQGYMAVESLWLAITNGNDLGGGGPVLTGPSLVDAANISRIAEYAARNTR
ncbi:substrate-binding domain-containing protein [Pseudonocardia sp. ICBG1122]|nr:substrate-binding domain-containing protein [Pseudonocardia pini]